MLTVRLPDNLEAEISRLAATEHRTKSEIIKAALRNYVASHARRDSSYEFGEFGEYLFGIAQSGNAEVITATESPLHTQQSSCRC